MNSECEPFFTRERKAVMFCDKAVPALYFHGSKDELTKGLSPQVFQQALQEAGNNAKRSDVFGRVPEDLRILHAVMHHEQDHLRRQFSTPAGLLQWAGTTCLTAFCGHLLVEIYRRGLRLNSHMVHVARACLGGNVATRSFASTREVIDTLATAEPLERLHLQVMVVCEFLRSIEGERREQSGIEGLFLAEAGLLLLNAWGDGGDGYELSAGSTFADESQWLDGPWIGAKHLFEGFATQEEACHLARLGCDSTPYAQMILDQPEYRMLLAAWHRKFLAMDCTRQGSLRSGDLILDTWRILPVEAYAAADLALWMPFGPAGIESAGRPLQWLDLQPGWRFSCATAVLAEMGCSGTSVGSDAREEVFDETQRQICERLDWPLPDRLGRLWDQHFRTGQWLTKGLFLGNEFTPGADIAQSMLERRSQCPFDVVLNNVPWNTDSRFRFPLWVTREAEQKHVHLTQDTPKAQSAYAATLQWMAVRRLLLGKKAGMDFELLMSAQQREAVSIAAAGFESAEMGLTAHQVQNAFAECVGV